MKFILSGLLIIGVCTHASPSFAATQESTPITLGSGKSFTSDAEPLSATSGADEKSQKPKISGVIKVVRIVGASVFKEAELRKLFAEYAGKEVTYTELEKAAGRISSYYKNRGMSVKVSMPPQDISEGIVLYYLVEGKKSSSPQIADAEKSSGQKLVTRDPHSGPLTRALSGQLSHGAFYLIKPTITVSEEFVDNFYATREKRKAALITSISPAINIEYSAKKWDWTLGYSPTYLNFLNTNRQDELINSASLEGKIRLIDSFLFLDINDGYRRTSIDTNREGESLFANQIDVNAFNISPYIRYHFTPRWSVIGGYSYSNRSTPSSYLINNQRNMVFLDLAGMLTPKIKVVMGANAAKVETSANITFSRFSPYAGFTYNFGVGSSVNAQAGYSLFIPQSGESSIAPYWNIGLGHTWRSYALSLTTGTLYEDQLGLSASETLFINAHLSKKFHRGEVGVSAKYSQVTNNQLGITGNKWFRNEAGAKYELTPRVTAAASVCTDKYIAEAEYHNSVKLAISYQLFYDLSLQAEFNRLVYSDIIFMPSGTTEINRMYISATKSF